MSNIKLKAWDRDKKEMLYWSTDKDAICDALPIDAGDEWTERCDIMRYSGLKDQEGIEVWSGDIRIYNSREYVVIDDIWRFILERTDEITIKKNGDYISIPLNENVALNSMWIGNIYAEIEDEKRRILLKTYKNHIKGYGLMTDTISGAFYGIPFKELKKYKRTYIEFEEDESLEKHIVKLDYCQDVKIPKGTLKVYGEF